jgi:hypothetical protein
MRKFVLTFRVSFFWHSLCCMDKMPAYRLTCINFSRAGWQITHKCAVRESLSAASIRYMPCIYAVFLLFMIAGVCSMSYLLSIIPLIRKRGKTAI